MFSRIRRYFDSSSSSDEDAPASKDAAVRKKGASTLKVGDVCKKVKSVSFFDMSDIVLKEGERHGMDIIFLLCFYFVCESLFLF